jgi:putative salt-induced outer membrane protein YdiY
MLVACASVAIPATKAVASEDTDVVVFENGDRLTGEMKSLDRARLSFDSDPTGTINIEWDKVAYIRVDQDIQVETESGVRYFGQISMAKEKFKVVVDTADGPAVLESGTVVAMDPIDEGGFRALDINVSLGYNYSKASNITQLNVGMDTEYRSLKRVLTVDFSSLVSASDNNDTSERESLEFNYTRLRSNRWLNDGGVSFDINDELGLNLRTSLSAGGGRILLQSNHSRFVLKGGLKATRESNVDQPEDVDSLESYGTVAWEWYRYDTPELDWSMSLEVIPSLTESGRVRGEYDATLKWEIISDFFWQLDYYLSYDNQPQSEEASSNDSGVTTSLVYKF